MKVRGRGKREMKKKNIAFMVVLLLLVTIGISICAMPAFAKINYEVELSYDCPDYFGEEIRTEVTINPGENKVKDMRVDILEADALIDDKSFEHKIFPAGADIIVTREGHTFSCDRLKKGESITLIFNAYPKTIKKKEIKVADVRIAYTQLGERLEDLVEIKAKHELKVDGGIPLPYFIGSLIGVAFIFFVIGVRIGGRREEE